MIEISYRTLNTKQFIEAMQRINTFPLPQAVGYQLLKITKEIERQNKKAQAEYLEKIAPMPRTTPEEQQAVTAAEEEFFNRTLQVDRMPIRASDMGSRALFTVSDLSMLEGIIVEELPVQEGKVVSLHPDPKPAG
jgi:transketolase